MTVSVTSPSLTLRWYWYSWVKLSFLVFFLTPQSQDKFSVMIPGSLYRWFPGTYLVVGRWWSVVPAVVEWDLDMVWLLATRWWGWSLVGGAGCARPSLGTTAGGGVPFQPMAGRLDPSLIVRPPTTKKLNYFNKDKTKRLTMQMIFFLFCFNNYYFIK